MKTRKSVLPTVIITTALAIIITIIITGFSAYGLVLSLILLILAGSETVVLYFLKKNVLFRKQNIWALISIVLLGATFVVSAADVVYNGTRLAGWSMLLGIALFFSGNYIIINSLMAIPRHAKDEYGEDIKPKENDVDAHGPYDIIRHPINLGAFLTAFSIPLIITSALGFIASGAAAVVIIIHAVVTENYRFENYNWYYDYTKQVPYMFFPVIW